MNLNNEVALGHLEHVRELEVSQNQQRVRFGTCLICPNPNIQPKLVYQLL